MRFDEEYYKKLCGEYGYSVNETEFSSLNYVYSYNINSPINKEDSLITSGYGMNNDPHIMTALQLKNMVALQRQGYKTQIVLGDYDVKLARQYHDFEEIASRYKDFILKLGYNNIAGVLRTQTGEKNAAANVVLISSELSDSDFSSVKEDLLDYYNDSAHTLSFPTKVSIALMIADFITPIIDGNAHSVVVACGIDESKYAVLANEVLRRLNVNGVVGGIFTNVTGGLNNHPKMSKSKPDSGIFLSDGSDAVVRKLKDSFSVGDYSVILQLALFADTSFSNEDILEIFRQEDVIQRKIIIEETIEYICSLVQIWKSTLS